MIGIVAALASLPVFLVEWLWPSWKPLALLVVAAAAYGIAYAGGLLALRMIQPDEWEIVRKVLRPVMPQGVMRYFFPAA
jgi:drug/metabolite transporter (DMT)-like permease